MHHDKRGDLALEDAFRTLMQQVSVMREAGIPLKQVKHAPAFSFLLTPKQLDRVKKICQLKGWPVPNQRGILIDLEAVAHPMASRGSKDNCSAAEVLAILVAAYSAYSQIGLNKPKHSQAIVFNTGRQVVVGGGRFYAVAVVEVRVDGARRYLAPVTAYHATEAKIRNIK
ncbi:hypothetical protein VA602_14990 [Pseudomonas sp. MH2]|uniref:Uncharacterized protein n=1 Tax=Pseudomonas machongensis TaxID=3110229 RepID=A0ABU5VGZ6_9PSED|nr:hypothetical protein [Pseudomonas sp. MH2]MEA5672643.1 hypothetical protein [Pseudomonas sp. MH2]